MKANAVPCPAATRSTMPTATAPSQAATPAGTTAIGCRHARPTSQPAASPARKGHDVLARPVSVSPLLWLARPITTNSRTQPTSATAAQVTERITARLAPAG